MRIRKNKTINKFHDNQIASIKNMSIVLILFLYFSTSCFAQNVIDTSYSYDAASLGSFYKWEMNAEYYLSSFFDDDFDLSRDRDSILLMIDFKSHGCMSFKKYYNGVLYLEGAYNSSELSEIKEVQGIDPTTEELLSPELMKYYYPTKCGEWKFYFNEKVHEELIFEDCKCQ